MLIYLLAPEQSLGSFLWTFELNLEGTLFLPNLKAALFPSQCGLSYGQINLTKLFVQLFVLYFSVLVNGHICVQKLPEVKRN